MLTTAAQQDDGGRRSGYGGFAGHRATVPLAAGAECRVAPAVRVSVPLPVPLAFSAVAETQTKQLWMCTSCGFVYDPDEGDPDGGIPPGTAFEDIPDTWFCPVCGARKSDFELYEE